MARGIVSTGVHLPRRRLDLGEVEAVAGTGGGSGHRTVACYDEDTTTMGVEAARLALRSAPEAVAPATLWFSTVAPAYADKTNATAVHAALLLDDGVPAFDANGSVRSAVGALRAALDGRGPALVVSADLRTGLPGSGDESAGGDAGAALLVGDGDGPLLAEVLGWGSATEEFLDRWRVPGAARSQLWEERFGEVRYTALGQAAWDDALKATGLVADQVDRVAVAAGHGRAAAGLVRKLGLASKAGSGAVAGRLAGNVGFTGAAEPALALSAALEDAAPGEVVALIVLADGADVLLLRTTEALASRRPAVPIGDQLDAGIPVTYGRYLSWRGFLPVEPPRRPEPARPSASAAGRSRHWKFGFVGSQGDGGEVHLPPAPAGPGRQERPRPMADATGTIVTFTVDRLAYSPSPPIVFAVVDFDGGGRLPVELTDVDAGEVRIGDRVEMTFRKLFTSDGIHNYFWKARPVTGGAGGAGGD